MSHPIFLSKLLIELSNQRQELVASSIEFELAGSGFANCNIG
ncbi:MULTISPECIES: hypothetical protein [Nostocaceae]|nr:MULTISPECIES: hypothetical protein [Nostocaceae]